MDQALALLTDLPPWLIYVVLGAGAVVENILPVVPADTFIVTGGFIAGLGTVGPAAVFVVVWTFNVAGAVAVYAAGLRYGSRFFRDGAGRRILAARQMRRLEDFYGRWGVAAIFVARFLPGFRAVVPVFAGVTGVRAGRVVPPLLAASAIWYGALIRVGYMAGDNLEAVLSAVERTNRGLLTAAVLLAAVVLALWWRARRVDTGGGEEEQGGP